MVAQIYVVATRDDDGPRTEVLGESFGNLQVMKASHTPAGGLAGGSTAKVAADGEFAAYESNSSGIVAGDTNGRTDVFLYSTARNTNERVSIGNAPTSAQGDGDSKDPSVSSDGRYVAFWSWAENFGVNGNPGQDVFVRDVIAGTTAVASAGVGGHSFNPEISSDGRYVAFTSLGGFMSGDTNLVQDIFLFDLRGAVTEQRLWRVSNTPGFNAGNNQSQEASISGDGRYVAYWSDATDLVAGDTNAKTDIFVWDRTTEATTRVSVSSAGTQGNGISFAPSISDDGRYVVFHSQASNLVAGDTNGTYDVFLRDLVAGTTTRVSTSTSGTQGNGNSIRADISPDGRYASFESAATNLVTGDTNGFSDIFVRDLVLGSTIMVSVAADGTTGNGNSAVASLSSGARFAAFESSASTLTPGDTTGLDVFVRADAYTAPPPIPASQTMGLGMGFAARPGSFQADPVNSATGAFSTSVTDAAFAAIGVGFSFDRAYNSNDAAAGSLGPGWTHGYAAALTFDGGGNASFRTGDGQILAYTHNPDGSFTGAPGTTAALTANADGSFTVLTRTRVRYSFASSGRLTGVVDRNGVGLTLGYDQSGRLATVAGSGRTASLGYNPDGTLASLVMPDNRAVLYFYTGGRLTRVRDMRGQDWVYGYDAGGRLNSIKDPLNHYAVRLTYHPTTGRVTEQLDARDNATTFSWDAATETSTMTAPRGGTWKDTYSGGVLVSQTDPLGNVTRFEFDGAYRLRRAIDAKGQISALSYDPNGNIILEQTPDGSVKAFTYDAMNNLTSSTNGRGTTVQYSYDGNGNLIGTSRPRPGGSGAITTTLTHDAGTGLLTGITDARGMLTTYEYTANGDLRAVVSPLAERTVHGYDATGRNTSMIEARGNAIGGAPELYTWTMGYDAADNLVSVVDPLGNTTSTQYDNAGNITSTTDTKGRVSTYSYNQANQVTSAASPDGSIPANSYTYNADGLPATFTDPKGHVTSYAYDLADRLTGLTTPLGGWTFGYDELNNRTAITDPGSATTTLGYDAMNRLSAITYPDGTPSVSYAYDKNGNRTTMTDGLGTATYSYDALDRLVHVHRGSDDFLYSYDDAGNVTARVLPDQTTQSFSYDDDSRMLAMASNGVEQARYRWDAAGHLIHTARPYPVHNEVREWDRAGRLTEVRDVMPGTSADVRVLDPRTLPVIGADADIPVTLTKTTYVLDPAGNPTRTIDQDQKITTYEYDALDRLTAACFDAPVCLGASDFIRWAYDGNGNIATETRPAGTSTFSYNAADELTQVSAPTGTTTYGYNALGDQTQAGASSFVYSRAGRMTSATVSGTTTTYAYDGDGRRTSTNRAGVVTQSVRDPLTGDLLLERTAGGSVLRRYAFGLGPISMEVQGTTGGPFYFHVDGRGSPLALTDAAANVQRRTTWEPYGRSRTSTQVATNPPGNPIGWSGSYADDTGLNHMGTRQYDPAAARFTGVDKAASGEPYAYGGSNPVARIDPTATDWRDWIGPGIRTVNSVARGVTVVAGTVTVACAAAVVCSPVVAVTGPLTVGAGAITAGTSIAIAFDTCATGKGSCAGSVVTAAIDSAAGGLGAWGQGGIRASRATPAVGDDLLRPGPWARESVPATSTGRATPAQQAELNRIGDAYGCHSCGAPTSGVKSGNWIGDHQPVTRTVPSGTPQVLYPHCQACSNDQGLWIINLIRQGRL